MRRKVKKNYTRKKREYKEICERKKEKWWEELKRKAKEAQTQRQVWKVISKKRKKMRINDDIEIEN